MMEFLLKSSVSLLVFYGIYFLLLRNIKTFGFNRYYLLFSLLVSIVIPFIHIQTDIYAPVYPTIQDISAIANGFVLQENVTGQSGQNMFTAANIVSFVYFLISAILFIRLIRNLYSLTKKIRKSDRLTGPQKNILLVPEKTLPYSFFNNIFINRSDYKKGKIDHELMLHENVHCHQFHSLDILIIELIKIILWFNPVIWLYKKDMQLNHEYLADEGVLSGCDLSSYQQTILKLVFRNNSTYLASNFNYSLTKKRLIMMKKNNSSHTIVRKVAVVTMAMILVFSISFGQDKLVKDGWMNFDNEWWSPILKKHHMEPQSFNNFGKVFEMGSSNSINDGIVTLIDAVFIIGVDEENYIMIKSPKASHDIEKGIISGETGVLENYTISGMVPMQQMQFVYFEYNVNNGNYKAENATGVMKK